MSNEALTWAKWVSHQLSKRAKHLELQAAAVGQKKPKNPSSGTPMHVLMVLADYANEDWQCWPKQSTLVDDTGGISERTIRRSLGVLQDLGLVTTQRLITKTGARWGTTFQLHVEALESLITENQAMGIRTGTPRLGTSRKFTKISQRMPLNASPDNMSGGAQPADTMHQPNNDTPMIPSPDNMSGGQASPVVACPDNMSGSPQEKTGVGGDCSTTSGRSLLKASPDNMTGRHESPLILSPDNMSGGQASPVNGSPDNLAGGEPTGQKRPALPDKNDIFVSGYLKEHARINHHHQSSDERSGNLESTINDDDDDLEVWAYRNVNVDRLFQDVPKLAGYAGDHRLVESMIDVVLDRARGRVGQPTAYVRRSLDSDLYGIAAIAMDFPRDSDVAPVVPLHGACATTLDNQGPKVVAFADRDAVPLVAELPQSAIPCTNMDHLRSYDMTSRMLAHCNHCRIEQLGSGPSQPPHDTHVANATQKQIAALPSRLQHWVLQWHTGTPEASENQLEGA